MAFYAGGMFRGARSASGRANPNSTLKRLRRKFCLQPLLPAQKIAGECWRLLRSESRRAGTSQKNCESRLVAAVLAAFSQHIAPRTAVGMQPSITPELELRFTRRLQKKPTAPQLQHPQRRLKLQLHCYLL